jgi:hypothetical protein
MWTKILSSVFSTVEGAIMIFALKTPFLEEKKNQFKDYNFTNGYVKEENPLPSNVVSIFEFVMRLVHISIVSKL